MTIKILALRGGDDSCVNVEADDLSEILKQKDSCVWVDIEARSPESDAILGTIFGFHFLAIEDVYNDQHRPKVEDYDEYLYIIFRGLANVYELKEVKTIELDLFLGVNFVVTHHDASLKSISTVQSAIEKGDFKAMARGSVFLTHKILDTLVDRYLPLADAYEQEIGAIERSVLSGGDELIRIVDLKGGLQRIRRLVIAHRDLAARLAKAEFDEIPVEAKPFFRDVHEHLGQLTEQLEDQRLDLNAVFDAFHSLSAHRMNEIMKVLTLISTIMLPLTFLVGVYGMNFDYMPETKWAWGYPLVWTVMIGIVIVQLAYFRRRRWL
jgi:magnesium transporter